MMWEDFKKKTVLMKSELNSVGYRVWINKKKNKLNDVEPFGFQAFVMWVSHKILPGYIKQQARLWLRRCLNELYSIFACDLDAQGGQFSFSRVRTRRVFLHAVREQEADGGLSHVKTIIIIIISAMTERDMKSLAKVQSTRDQQTLDCSFHEGNFKTTTTSNYFA